MKTKVMFLTAALFLITLVSSCDKKDTPELVDANSTTVVDATLYEKTNPVNVTDIKVLNDSLYVRISASGCDTKTWKARLIDAGSIAYSMPVQRKAKIEFTNLEECLAALAKTFAFDLKPLRIGSAKEVNIVL